jgi:hypothetical protein
MAPKKATAIKLAANKAIAKKATAKKTNRRMTVTKNDDAVAVTYTCRPLSDFDPTGGQSATLKVNKNGDPCFLVMIVTDSAGNSALQLAAYVTKGAPAKFTPSADNTCSAVDCSAPLTNGIDIDAISAAIVAELL